MITINLDKNSKRLDPYRDRIVSQFNGAIERIQGLIPVDNVSVIVFDKPEHTIPETGEGGFSLNANNIEVYFNPDFPGFEDRVLGEEFPRCLAHELHHCLRWVDPGYGDTLLEQIITEGLADHFEVEFSGGSPGPWAVRLNDSEISEWLEKARPLFNTKDFDRNAWMFGSKEKGIPTSTGYSLGFYLVGEYLKNNKDQKASTLYNKRAEEFI